MKIICKLLNVKILLVLVVLNFGLHNSVWAGVANTKNNSAKALEVKVLEAKVTEKSTQDLEVVKTKVFEYLRTQSQGLPGIVSVTVGQIDRNIRLANCPVLEVFMPQGSRVWGKTSVGVRCNLQPNWIIYVQANVSVSARYVVASLPLAQGHVIGAEDLIFESGDLAQLPAGIFTEMSQVVGRSLNISITPGAVLRQEMLRQPSVVQQGQAVKLVSSGVGFDITADGKALNKASVGQVVQVKVPNGQVISGIARSDGVVDVKF